jgi:hypothetical protein
MKLKLFTEKEKELYRLTFAVLDTEGFFNHAIRQLPFTINQEPQLGAYNLGFFMWKAGREDMLDYVIELAQSADDMEVVLKKLIAFRAQQALDAVAEEKEPHHA